uniref:Condensin complex subunit 2 n=1 Tax=Fagus sylvatica TaxID=28930 RepID=A0A2N9IKJ2_FAGSY
MAEEPLSPRPTITTQRAPIATRLQSPTSPFFLGSNDDQLERAQARAARAAANRRIAPTTTTTTTPSPETCLNKQQIVDLFHNCIKLASENKINQKNTWELKLIDHLSEIIKVEAENNTETNFQKASCTLEAGVKIYSVRVDSVLSEAYKVLGGINRAGIEDEQETIIDGDNGQDTGHSKKESEKKVSPMSTLESSFEALNVKKFDVAFSVDPLYHQTSAQFDEGGAKGLLLNNLGVYGGCRVLFDSFEVPGKCNSCSSQTNTSDMVDLSFAQESIEQMVMNMRAKNEISPTLKEIISQFDNDNQRPSQTFNVSQQSDVTTDAYDDNEVDFDSNLFENHDAWADNHEDETSSVNQSSSFRDPSFQSHEENDPYTMCEPDVGDRFEKVSIFLFQGLGITSKRNAWAGPDHWKYQRSKGSEDTAAPGSGQAVTNKRTKKKIQTEADVDFTSSLDKEVHDIFLSPKNPKSLLLPANRAPTSNRLPDDCHYQPEDLVKLFLLPNVLEVPFEEKLSPVSNACSEPLTTSGSHYDALVVSGLLHVSETGDTTSRLLLFVVVTNGMPILIVVPWEEKTKNFRKYLQDELVDMSMSSSSNGTSFSGRSKVEDVNSWQGNSDFDEALPSWDNDSVLSGQYDDGCVHNDVDHLDGLVSQPRRVNKVEVNYDKTSKQVDVHALKESLWDQIQEYTEVPKTVSKDTISFRHLLSSFPVDCQAAAPKDISPHLCFICLLHLANEHGLSIHDCPTLDDLRICLPSTSSNSDGVVQFSL